MEFPQSSILPTVLMVPFNTKFEQIDCLAQLLGIFHWNTVQAIESPKDLPLRRQQTLHIRTILCFWPYSSLHICFVVVYYTSCHAAYDLCQLFFFSPLLVEALDIFHFENCEFGMLFFVPLFAEPLILTNRLVRGGILRCPYVFHRSPFVLFCMNFAWT